MQINLKDKLAIGAISFCTVGAVVALMWISLALQLSEVVMMVERGLLFAALIWAAIVLPGWWAKRTARRNRR